jgi:hypothetical protein
MITYFNRFSIKMTLADAKSAAHQRQCYADVAALIKSKRVSRPKACTPENLAAELKEYGAWEADDLLDDKTNWERIVWIAAGNIAEENKRN